MNADFNHF